ncbi:MAG: threonine ammonia-lyase [Nocardioidaceae bacterium]
MDRARLVDVTDIVAAADRIAASVRHTPLVSTDWGRPSHRLWLKPESLQVGGSFKIRGATNAVAQLTGDERARGVITHSSGNHAQALARAARAVGVQATIVMPRQAAEVKRLATEAAGGHVVLVDASERESALAALQDETGAVFIPPYDSFEVIAGQGTVGLEIVTDLPDVASVLVPVSGGGLISGVAAAVKGLRPGVPVIGVEPDLAGDLAEGFARGERVVWESARTVRTIADGLRVTGVGEHNWEHIKALVDDVVTVSEEAIRSAMRALLLQSHLVAEPSGAVAVAGFFEYADRIPPGPCVAVVSGGNAEPALLRELLSR